MTHHEFCMNELRKAGITADKIARNELTSDQYDTARVWSKTINTTCTTPKMVDYYIVSDSEYIIQIEGRFFHLAEHLEVNTINDKSVKTYSDIYEMEKIEYEKTISVTEYVKKGKKKSDFEAEIEVFPREIKPYTRRKTN